MKLRNGVTNAAIQCADLCMVSASEERIVLPYVGAMWDDVMLEALHLAWSAYPLHEIDEEAAFDFERFVRSCAMRIGFSVQRDRILTYADILVDTQNDKKLSKRLLMDASDAEVFPILSYFFNQKNNGLNPCFHKYLKKVYLMLKK